MKVVILATNEQKREIGMKDTRDNVSLIFIDSLSEIECIKDVDLIFLLTSNPAEDTFEKYIDKHVIIHSVVDTLIDKKLPENYSRINAWPGFLKRPIWDIASNNEKAVDLLLKQIGWDAVFVRDTPGLVAARVISMVINEAYFALEEKVSTIKEIDLAMLLGTNYPTGPFEWKNIIGIQNIYALLQKLSVTDKRYLIASLLEEEYRKTQHP